MALITGELPAVFLQAEDKQMLEGIILCGPQRLADKMKEVVQFKDHTHRLTVGTFYLRK